jgi:hypothetical protein
LTAEYISARRAMQWLHLGIMSAILSAPAVPEREVGLSGNSDRYHPCAYNGRRLTSSGVINLPRKKSIVSRSLCHAAIHEL